MLCQTEVVRRGIIALWWVLFDYNVISKLLHTKPIWNYDPTLPMLSRVLIIKRSFINVFSGFIETMFLIFFSFFKKMCCVTLTDRGWHIFISQESIPLGHGIEIVQYSTKFDLLLFH